MCEELCEDVLLYLEQAELAVAMRLVEADNLAPRLRVWRCAEPAVEAFGNDDLPSRGLQPRLEMRSTVELERGKTGRARGNHEEVGQALRRREVSGQERAVLQQEPRRRPAAGVPDNLSGSEGGALVDGPGIGNWTV